MKRILPVIPGLLGLLVLTAWAFNWESVERLGLSSVSMNPVTALCIVLISYGLTVELFDVQGALFKYAGGAFIVCAMVIAALKLCDVLMGTNIAIDGYLFPEQLSHNRWFPSRMAPNAALCILLLGAAALLALRRTQGAIIASQLLAIVTATIAAFAVVGYLYSVPTLYIVRAFIPMAVHTAAAFILLSLALLTLAPGLGLVPALMDRGPGGRSARLLLPAAVFVPLTLGWLRQRGEHAGLYGSDTGVALMVTTTVLMLAALIVWNSRLLLRVDRRRTLAEAQLLRLATHDTLTGLPNRALFLELVGTRLASYTRRPGEKFAVCYADLDDFKQVNDRLGHDAGDELLKLVSAHLRDCMRGEDVAARIGGDEFTLLLERIACPADAEIVATRILSGMPKFCGPEGARVPISISIGMTIVAGHTTPQALLKDADEALYRAKQAGKGRFAFAEVAGRVKATPAEAMEVMVGGVVISGPLSA